MFAFVRLHVLQVILLFLILPEPLPEPQPEPEPNERTWCGRRPTDRPPKLYIGFLTPTSNRIHINMLWWISICCTCQGILICLNVPCSSSYFISTHLPLQLSKLALVTLHPFYFIISWLIIRINPGWSSGTNLEWGV